MTRFRTTVVALVGGALLLGPGATAQDEETEAVTSAPDEVAGMPTPDLDEEQRYIVTFQEGSSAAQSARGRGQALARVARETGVRIDALRAMSPAVQVIEAEPGLTEQGARRLVRALESRPDVEHVDRDIRLTAAWTPNDPDYRTQWHYQNTTGGIRLPQAWDNTRGEGVMVSVLDSGLTSHPDLDGNVVAGYDFVDANLSRDGDGWDPNPRDEGDWCEAPSSWHGTHVAGTVAAVTDNGTGVAGVAPRAGLQPVRVLGACGGYLSDIAAAVRWAAGAQVNGAPTNTTPADVINMSLGGSSDSCPPAMQAAIDVAVGRGATVVVAAGNDGTEASTSVPANCANVVTVAASTSSGSRAGFSNYGRVVDVTAPGSSILSTSNTGSTVPAQPGYAWMGGTSMAAPHVAGLAALMLQLDPSLTPAQVEGHLKAGARVMPGSCTGGCGAGLVDAQATVGRLLAGTPDPEVGYDGDGYGDVLMRRSNGDLMMFSG
ncbi:S8 family peptidase, partial [Ornithinicoccus halotolerans]|uniref:S8 family peptidase n=1 Tax=Ornithinicoccus halotolerans TaxID=1748220 RepID=UPI001296FAA1